VSGIGAVVHNAEMLVRAPGLLLVHLMMIKLPFADSIAGPSVTRTRSAALPGGSILASGTSGEAMELEAQ